MLAGEQVGDRFGLHLDHPAAVDHGTAVGVQVGVVEEHVAEFVGEGLDGLGVVDVDPDRDLPAAEVGDPVRAGQRLGSGSADPVAAFDGVADQGVPQPGRRFTGQQLRCRRGDRVAVGLADVEHRDGPVADHPRPCRRRALGCRPVRHCPVAVGPVAEGCVNGGGLMIRVCGGAAADDGGEDADGLFAAADLPPGGLPGAVARHDGGVGALLPDQDQVAEAVLVQAAGERQPGRPVGPGLDLLDRVLELLVQVLEGGAAVLVGLFPFRRGPVPPVHGRSGPSRWGGVRCCRSAIWRAWSAITR